MIKNQIEMMETAIVSNYKDEFQELNEIITQRASAGFYETRVDYKDTQENTDMLRVFHSYLVLKGYVVYVGTIDKFPFISVHWA